MDRYLKEKFLNCLHDKTLRVLIMRKYKIEFCSYTIVYFQKCFRGNLKFIHLFSRLAGLLELKLQVAEISKVFRCFRLVQQWCCRYIKR